MKKTNWTEAAQATSDQKATQSGYVLVEAATGEVKYASCNDMGHLEEFGQIIGLPLPGECKLPEDV